MISSNYHRIEGGTDAFYADNLHADLAFNPELSQTKII